MHGPSAAGMGWFFNSALNLLQQFTVLVVEIVMEQGLEFINLPGLFDDHLIEVIKLVFKVCQGCFECEKSLFDFVVHEDGQDGQSYLNRFLNIPINPLAEGGP